MQSYYNQPRPEGDTPEGYPATPGHSVTPAENSETPSDHHAHAELRGETGQNDFDNGIAGADADSSDTIAVDESFGVSTSPIPNSPSHNDATSTNEIVVVEVELEISTLVVGASDDTRSDDTRSEDLASGETVDGMEDTPIAEDTAVEDNLDDDLDDDDIVCITPTTARMAQLAAREDNAQTRQQEFDRLFAEWHETNDPHLRERLILMNRNLVSYLARKYMDRGEMSEDVIQQGLIGLIYALDHFDPSRGVRFATFATPTILGEIRRYFRDKTWGIRIPRRLQELNQVISSRIEILSQELDRSPTYNEIARALGLQVEEVVEALEMVHAMEPLSIDEQVYSGEDDTATVVSDHLGAPDPDLEGWGEYAALESALEKLPENERRVLQMAYFQDHSQVEIARQMQVSQMYVSRLQRKALAHLRDLMNSVDI